MTYKIVKAVQTSAACPAQWDAWTDTGQYLYLRYRNGWGTVEEFDTTDHRQWPIKPPEVIFDTGRDLDGSMTLEEFARCAGLTLALGSEGSPS